MGNNVASISKKKDSLKALIETCKRPSCITLQETNLGKSVKFDIENYEVFQNNRNSSGGGLLTAVDPSLNPWVVKSEDSSPAEILTVQLEVNENKIRLINGYGPQNDENLHNRLAFWTELDQEVVSAFSEGCLLVIQMDANAKVGNHMIKWLHQRVDM